MDKRDAADDYGWVLPTVQWVLREGVRGWRYDGLATSPWGLERIGATTGFAARKVGSHHVFVAPTGETFDTVREMFSGFRLRRCRCDLRVDELEHMRRVLTLVETEVHRTDLDGFTERGFSGSRGFMEHFVGWLENERFLDCVGTTIADVSLTTEARAVLLMLRHSRPGSNYDASAKATYQRMLDDPSLKRFR